jgi:hypothetical protein
MDSDPEKIEEFDSLEDDLDLEDEINADIGEEQAETVEKKKEEVEPDEPMVDEAPEMMFSKEAQEAKEQEVLVKYCLFCREIIPAEAIACKHCGHVLHIFEGKVFKQLYWFFWGGLITFIGCFLPYYSGEATPLVTACHTFSGSLYLIFTILLLAAMVISIYSKRLIMSPVFLMFIPAVLTWMTVVKVIGGIEEADFAWYNCFYQIKALNLLTENIGSGLLLIWLGSTLVALTFIVSLVTAVAGGGKEKESPKAKPKARGRRR